MGFEDEAEQSLPRPCRQTNGRFKRTHDLTSSIVPRGASFHRSVKLECPSYRIWFCAIFMLPPRLVPGSWRLGARRAASGHPYWDRTQKVALADINAAMAQDRVGLTSANMSGYSRELSSTEESIPLAAA